VRKALLAAAPLALGLFLMALAHGGGISNPVLFMRIDLGAFLAALGALGGLALLVAFGVRRWTLRKSRREIISAQQREEEQRRQFLRRLDHEMKNPLTAARAAFANLPPEASGPALTSMRTQIDRLSRLTTDLRKLTDLETRPLEMAPVDLGQLLTELVAEANDVPRGRPVDLSLPSLPWPLPHVTGDWDLIYLACHNLLDNALKFGGPEAQVAVRAFEDGPMVAVEVADTGPGICAEDLPHLGEELYRGRGALGVEGSGLGLALVRAITHRHSGAMAVRSRVGKGTVVTLRFPAAAG
jgi:signal transduction histidine kinase